MPSDRSQILNWGSILDFWSVTPYTNYMVMPLLITVVGRTIKISHSYTYIALRTFENSPPDVFCHNCPALYHLTIISITFSYTSSMAGSILSLFFREPEAQPISTYTYLSGQNLRLLIFSLSWYLKNVCQGKFAFNQYMLYNVDPSS